MGNIKPKFDVNKSTDYRIQHEKELIIFDLNESNKDKALW